MKGNWEARKPRSAGVSALSHDWIRGLSVAVTHHWWLTYPSEKLEFVSWDDYSHIIYIYIWKIIKHVPDHQPVMVKFPFPTCHCWKNPTCCSFNLLPQWIIPWVSLAPHWRQHRAGSQYVADRFTIHWHWGHGGGHLNFASKSAHSMQLKSKFARISRMALEIHKSLK